MKKMLRKLALVLCAILIVNTVFADATLAVMAETVTESASVTFGYDNTSLSLGEVQWKNGDEEWHTQTVADTVSANHLRIKYANGGKLAQHTALRLNGVDIIKDNMSALESDDGMALEAGKQYAFEHIEFVANGGEGEQGPAGPRTGEIQINTRNGQNGKLEYKIDDGSWNEINGNPFTLRVGVELKDVEDGAKIYFRAIPNKDQKIDSHEGQNRVRYDDTDYDISADDLLEGAFYIEYNSAKNYSVQLAFEGQGEPGGEENPPLPEITDPIEISVSARYEAGFFSEGNPIRVDGYEVKDGKVTVNKATTHTIEIQLDYGAGLSKFLVNDKEYGFVAGPEDRYSVVVDEADSYEISLEKGEGHSASIVWAYDHDVAVEKYGNDDAWVENGRVELVSVERNGESIYDDKHTEADGISVREDGGDLFLEKGDNVVLKLIPNYEHQLVSIDINGVDKLTPEENVSTFAINNIQGNIHFKGVFKHADDIIIDNSEVITGACIGDGENAADSGNLQLTLNDNRDYSTDISEVTGGEKVASIDLELNNIVSKGIADEYWDNKIEEFEEDIRVALNIDFSTLEEGEEFSVVRDHKGELEELPVMCDYDNGVIEFSTNRFSTYTIVKNVVERIDPADIPGDEFWTYNFETKRYMLVIDEENPCEELKDKNIVVPANYDLIIAKDYHLSGKLTVMSMASLTINKNCALTADGGVEFQNVAQVTLGNKKSATGFDNLFKEVDGQLVPFAIDKLDNTVFEANDKGQLIDTTGRPQDCGMMLNTNGSDPECENSIISYKVYGDGDTTKTPTYEGVFHGEWIPETFDPKNFKEGTVVEFHVATKKGFKILENGVRFPNNKNVISNVKDETTPSENPEYEYEFDCSYTFTYTPDVYVSMTIDIIPVDEPPMEMAEFSWTYDRAALVSPDGFDVYVAHGTIEIISAEDTEGHKLSNGLNPDEAPYWTPADAEEELSDWQGNRWIGNRALFKAGSKVIVKLVPDRGYQLTRFTISDIEGSTTPMEGDDSVNTYTFVLERPDFYHLGAVFTKVDDKIELANATGVNGGSVTFADNEISNGSMVLSVSDSTPTEEEIAKFNAMANENGYCIEQCLSLESEQRFYKGVNDATREQCWVIDKSELDEPASITLDTDLSDEEVVLLHNHNGIYEEIPATCEDGSVTFVTQSFSDFVIATKCHHPKDMCTIKEIVEPGCVKDGKVVEVCSACNNEIVNVIPALGHNYINGVCTRDNCDIISLTLCNDIKVSVEDVKYDGNVQTPKAKVSYQGKELVADNDYVISVEGQKDIGTYQITITGIGNYTDEIVAKWSVIPNSGIWCDTIPDQVYTGKAIKPELEIFYDGLKLVAGKDYTLAYKNNIKVAASDAKNAKGVIIAPSVTITGKGNYSEKKTVYFSIVPKEIDTANVADILVAKTGRDIKIAPVVTLNGTKLRMGTDYVVSASKSLDDVVTAYKEAGTYKLYAVGKGNYAGAVAFNFTITSDVLASKVVIAKIANQTYDGNEIRPEVKITFNRKDVAENFKIAYENNVNVGTATVIISAKDGSGFVGSKTATFKITGLPITRAKLGADGKGTIPTAIYSGTEYRPALDLYDGTKHLDLYVDYTVAYSKNVNAGVATATVTGVGNYTGVKKLTYRIDKYNAQEDASKCITVDGGKPISVAYEKGGVTPKPVVKMGNTVLKEKTDYTLSYVNNRAKADATEIKAPTINVVFRGNFSGKKVVNFTITSKDIAECGISLSDKPVSSKANAWKQTVAAITDTNGKKLVAGTDYNKVFGYYSDDKFENEIAKDTLDPDTTVYVKIEGVNNYAGSFITGSYRVSSKNIATVKAVVAEQVFTGSEVCPAAEDIVVTVGIGKNQKTLEPGVDYIVVPKSYANNINKGTASVTIQGQGEYFGTKVVKYKIGVKKFANWFE